MDTDSPAPRKANHQWNSNPEDHEDFGEEYQETPRIGRLYERHDEEEGNETIEV